MRRRHLPRLFFRAAVPQDSSTELKELHALLETLPDKDELAQYNAGDLSYSESLRLARTLRDQQWKTRMRENRRSARQLKRGASLKPTKSDVHRAMHIAGIGGDCEESHSD
jgi:hypothetical protein